MRLVGFVILSACLAAVGCAPRSADDSQSARDADPAYDAADTNVRNGFAEGASTGTVAGSYYRGDGTGFNLHLDLAADGGFSCVWRGCLGEYGNCAGTWQRNGDVIQISVVTVDGMFGRSPLGDLEVKSLDDKPILIQLNDREFFDKWGPSRYSCFAKEGHELRF